MRVCGLFVRAAQLDFEWALCTQGMCRGGDSHFFPFLPSSLLSGFLWLSLKASVSRAELRGGGAGGGRSASSCRSKGKFRGYRACWREGPICRRQIKQGREVYISDKTLRFYYWGRAVPGE